MPIEFFSEPFNVRKDLKFDEEGLEGIRKVLSINLIATIKDQINMMVVPSLGPLNFRSRAIKYMVQNNIPLTETGIPGVKGVSEDVLGIKQYSMLALQEFIANVDNMIIYDEQSNSILMDPILEELELGSLDFQIFKTLSRAVEQEFPEV